MVAHSVGSGDRFRPHLVAGDGGAPPAAPSVRHQLEELAAKEAEYFMLAGLPEVPSSPGTIPARTRSTTGSSRSRRTSWRAISRRCRG